MVPKRDPIKKSSLAKQHGPYSAFCKDTSGHIKLFRGFTAIFALN